MVTYTNPQVGNLQSRIQNLNFGSPNYMSGVSTTTPYFQMGNTMQTYNPQAFNPTAPGDTSSYLGYTPQPYVPTNPQFTQDIARQTTLKNAKEAEIKQLGSQLDELKQLRSPQNPSWFHTLAATGILGATVGTGFQAASLATGGVLGRTLATPTAQRVMAGQTGPQMATQRFLQSDATGRTADILARSIGRTGMMTGGQ